MERNDVNADSKDNSGQTPLWRAADRGHETVVKLLLERNDINADSKDSSGQTPLRMAADRGHEAAMRLLLECNNVDVNWRKIKIRLRYRGLTGWTRCRPEREG